MILSDKRHDSCVQKTGDEGCRLQKLSASKTLSGVNDRGFIPLKRIFQGVSASKTLSGVNDRGFVPLKRIFRGAILAFIVSASKTLSEVNDRGFVPW